MSTSQLRTSIVSPGRAMTRLMRSRSAAPCELVEHDDVAAVGVVQPVRELVDEHPVAVVQRRRHRRAVDDEVGEHERAHQERHEQGDADDDDPVEEGAPPAGRLIDGAGVSSSSPSSAIAPRRDHRPSASVAPRSSVIVAARSIGHSDSISFSTRSSRLLNGSLHSTVRCAWSLSLRCTQSTV